MFPARARCRSPGSQACIIRTSTRRRRTPSSSTAPAASSAEFGVSGNDPERGGRRISRAASSMTRCIQGITSYDTAQYAVFGEGTYYPLPNVRLTAGARYQFARDGESTFQNYFYDYGSGGTDTSVGHFYTFLPKFAVGWDITPRTTRSTPTLRKASGWAAKTVVSPTSPSDANNLGTPAYDLKGLGLNARRRQGSGRISCGTSSWATRGDGSAAG